MNNETMQQDMSPEEALASLGLATRLNDELLMAQHPMEATESPENAPQQEETPEVDIDARIEEKVTQAVKQEVAGIKEILTEVLKEDEQE
jgi:hypothetical protein